MTAAAFVRYHLLISLFARCVCNAFTIEWACESSVNDYSRCGVNRFANIPFRSRKSDGRVRALIYIFLPDCFRSRRNFGEWKKKTNRSMQPARWFDRRHADGDALKFRHKISDKQITYFWMGARAFGPHHCIWFRRDFALRRNESNLFANNPTTSNRLYARNTLNSSRMCRCVRGSPMKAASVAESAVMTSAMPLIQSYPIEPTFALWLLVRSRWLTGFATTEAMTE